ncbi:hypothetical protein EIN_052250 [Entamoeba invadens IP1]|uniref:hypothetical protein n=1 Tax=Entamoeba invadens IP1 TaxID=370355 RepID=UPI0002C3DAEE|nr:hypothetical protein EIN_052250 [Entamoeba invadens IP1]ELP93020.1 hypothetical protein EIN_052250 [Entamoeba invadens IP1]|eukprot:XP_004259791.1 hypothetical protein EIN_052250 [Entamoeba invadens IP1]
MKTSKRSNIKFFYFSMEEKQPISNLTQSKGPQNIEQVIDDSISKLDDGNKVCISPALALMLNGMAQPEFGQSEKVNAMFSGLHALKICRDTIADEDDDVESSQIPLVFAKKCKLLYLGVKNVLCGVELSGTDLNKTLVQLNFTGVSLSSVSEKLGLGTSSRIRWPLLQILKLKYCQLTELEDIFNSENFPVLRVLDVSHNHITKIKRIGERPLDVLKLDYNEIRVVSCRQVRNISVFTIDNNKLKHLNGLKRLYNLRKLSAKNNLIDRDPSTFEVFRKMYCLEELYLSGNPMTFIPNYTVEIAKILPCLQFGTDCKLDGASFTLEEKVKAFSEVKQTQTVNYIDDTDDFDFSQSKSKISDIASDVGSTLQGSSIGKSFASRLRGKLMGNTTTTQTLSALTNREETLKDEISEKNEKFIESKIKILQKKSSENPAEVVNADKFIRKIRRIVSFYEDLSDTNIHIQAAKRKSAIEIKAKEEAKKVGKKTDWTNGQKRAAGKVNYFALKEKVVDIRFDDYEDNIPAAILLDIIRRFVAVDKLGIKIRFLSAKKKWDGVVNINCPIDFPLFFDFLRITNSRLKHIVGKEKEKTDFLTGIEIDKEDPEFKNSFFFRSDAQKSDLKTTAGLSLEFNPVVNTTNFDGIKIKPLNVTSDMISDEDSRQIGIINDLLSKAQSIENSKNI